jgi:GT2 family glycosyltransferase
MENPNVSSNIAIFTATKGNNWHFPLAQTALELNLDDYIHSKFNNRQGLAKVYNEFLDLAIKEKFEYVMFIHDDVHLEHDPRPKLEKLFQEFDIVGVAGCSQAEIKSPALWHLMGGGFGSGNLHGAVAHGNADKKHMTSFGAYPHRVVMIDGVFMAFNRKAIEKVRFDEDCPSGFHFYDCCYCARALEKGLKIGVGDVMITHESPGLREFTEDWKAGESYYIQTYGK